MTEAEFIGCIDLGGTKISSALISRDGSMLSRHKSPTDREGGDRTGNQISERLESLVQAAEESNGRLVGIGICVPGIYHMLRGTVWAPNIPGWESYPLRDRIREREGIPPLVIDSDRSAYVAGEAWLGAAAGAKDAVFLAVGTGIGAGILSGGRIIRGHGEIAGAVGWFGLNPDFKTSYAEMGCFEAEASAASMARKARRLMAGDRPSLMKGLAAGGFEGITAEIVAEAARKKDPVALELVEDIISYLSMGIANIVSILNPEVVVLGGGLFQAGDIFFDPLREGFRRWAQPLAAEAARLEITELGEDAGLFGCASLAWESLST